MSLRSWLRRSPQPARLRVRIDDEERFLELSADARNRWKAAEEACTAMRATSVECLDADGAVLRAQRLEVEDEPGELDGGAPEYDRRHEEKLLSKERRDLAAIIANMGTQLNTAFDRGASAAGISQENLVGLVETLSNHLSLAITNLHNVSVSLAQVMQQGGSGHSEEPAGPEQMISKFLGLAAAKAASDMGNDGVKTGAKKV